MRQDNETELVVRKATIQDAPSVARVFIDTWQDTYAAILPIERLSVMSKQVQTQAWTSRIQQMNSVYKSTDQVVVATNIHNKVIGFGDCGLNRRMQYPYKGEVFTLYVHPDYQGYGAGRKMLVKLFRHLMQNHFTSVLVWALRDNPNRHFYSSLHGEIVGERTSNYWGASIIEVAYAWSDLSKWALTMKSKNRN